MKINFFPNYDILTMPYISVRLRFADGYTLCLGNSNNSMGGM